ncbi:MAG TPA: HipA family kinase [Casimicrobiaceae bacterium]
MTEIVEVIRRSEQGVTRPFLCRSSDGVVYFVKGRGAGRRSLICELLAVLLAKHLELPIAPFRVLTVPAELDKALPNEQRIDLGTSPVFGSERIELAQEVNPTHLEQLENPDGDVPLMIFGFDLWIRNGDRTLTRLGGNPNLLWSPHEPRLRIIDHNVAFAEDFSRQDFFDTHVFAKWVGHVPDWVRRTEFGDAMSAALEHWDGFVDQVPDEWWYTDDERTVPTAFDADAALNMLKSCKDDHFWDAP